MNSDSRKKWDMKAHFTEIKIGVFFLVAIALVFITLLSIPETGLFQKTYIIPVSFDFAEGLRPSSPVRYRGVDVGEVDKVKVEGTGGSANPAVTVYAKIEDSVHIPKGSYFFINSLSLFGEKYLEIAPPENVEGYLAPGETVEGISPIALFNVFAAFNKTMKEIHEFVKEGKIKTSFENTMANLETTSGELKGLVMDMRSEKGTIGRLLYDDSLYEKSEEFIDDLKAHPWKILYKPRGVH